MPIIKSAAKKLRQDKKRTQTNKKELVTLKKAVKLAREAGTTKNIDAAFSALDTAAKKRVIHKNKANRLKSQLAKNQIKKSPKSQPKANRPPAEKTKSSS